MMAASSLEVLSRSDPAPLWLRFAAAAINTLVPAVAVLVGWGAALHSLSVLRTTVIIVILVVLVANALRLLWTLSRKGWSPGLAAARLSLVREDTGKPLGWLRATSRQIVFVLLTVTGVGWLVSMASARKDEKRRTLHDRAVRGVVVAEERAASPGSRLSNASAEAGAEDKVSATTRSAVGKVTERLAPARWEVLSGNGTVTAVTGFVLLSGDPQGADRQPPRVIVVADDKELESWSQLVIDDDGSELLVHDLGWTNEAVIISPSGTARKLRPFAPVALDDDDTVVHGEARVHVRRIRRADRS